MSLMLNVLLVSRRQFVHNEIFSQADLGGGICVEQF